MKRRSYFKSIMSIIFTPVKCIFKRTPLGNKILACMVADMGRVQHAMIAMQRTKTKAERTKQARAMVECITNTAEGITRALNGEFDNKIKQ